MQKELQSLGLSKYESECYITLLENGPITGKEISNKTSLPRTSVYPNLESLETKGFIFSIQQSPRIYKAKEPEIAILNYTKLKIEALKEISETTISRLKQIIPNKKIEELPIEIFLGKRQSYPITKNISDNTKKELLIIGSGERMTISNAFDDWASISKKGVKIKLIFPLTDDNEELLKKLKKKGIQIKNYNLQNLSFIISDDKITHFAIKSDKIASKRISIKIDNADFTKAQKTFFKTIWDKAEEI